MWTLHCDCELEWLASGQAKRVSYLLFLSLLSPLVPYPQLNIIASLSATMAILHSHIQYHKNFSISKRGKRIRLTALYGILEKYWWNLINISHLWNMMIFLCWSKGQADKQSRQAFSVYIQNKIITCYNTTSYICWNYPITAIIYYTIDKIACCSEKSNLKLLWQYDNAMAECEVLLCTFCCLYSGLTIDLARLW